MALVGFLALPLQVEQLPPAPAPVAVEKPPQVTVSRGTVRNIPYAQMELEVTAYCTGTITRSGLPVDVGALAVDPNLIPLGSIILLDGIGYVVGIDTGGVIKGNKADLYMKSEEQAIQWGRRKVRATIFELR